MTIGSGGEGGRHPVHIKGLGLDPEINAGINLFQKRGETGSSSQVSVCVFMEFICSQSTTQYLIDD